MLDSIKKLSEVAEGDIPDVVIDWANRIGRTYKDHISNKNCKSIIYRFSTV